MEKQQRPGEYPGAEKLLGEAANSEGDCTIQSLCNPSPISKPSPDLPCLCQGVGTCRVCLAWTRLYHENIAEHKRYGSAHLPLPMIRDAFNVPVDFKVGTRTHIIPTETAQAIALITKFLRERGEELPITDSEALRRAIKILKRGRYERI
jgi:hypothetical protein